MTATKWALITGASRGLGLELARLAATDQYNLLISDVDPQALDAAADSLRSAHPVQVIGLPADLSHPDAPAALWARATDGRQIDVLVNNAGLGRYGAMGTEDGGGDVREQLCVAVNVTALTALTSLALRHMRARGTGRILNIASIAAWMPGPNMAAYHASKAYVLSLSQAAAEELRGTPISVTALCPGPLKTAFFEQAQMPQLWINRLVPAHTPAYAARVGWNALKRGRRQKIVGFGNAITVLLAHLSHKSIVTAVTKALWSPVKR